MSLTTIILYSLFFFFGMFSFTGAILLFIQFRNDNQNYVKNWVIASILLSTATFLVALNNFLPRYISYNVSNTLNVASYVYFYYSCYCLTEKKISFQKINLHAMMAALIFALGLLWIEKFFDLKYERALVSFAGMVFNLLTSILVYQFHKKFETRFSLALGILFLASGLAWGIRLFMILFNDLGFAFQGGIINLVTFLILATLAVMRYMCFVGLATNIEWNKKELLIAQINAMKVELVKKEVEQTEDQYLTTLNALAKARDNETGNHIIRTQHYVNILASRLRKEGYYPSELSDRSIASMVKAAPLHDIGKVGIPDSILLKKGKLTDEEWEVMKTHAKIGESVLDSLEINQYDHEGVITKARRIAGGHHEKWNGSGYPRGLVGLAIPLEARIMSLADMYDALVSARVYKKAWSHERAFQEIVSLRNVQFDPCVVEAFIAEHKVFAEIAQTYKDV